MGCRVCRAVLKLRKSLSSHAKLGHSTLSPNNSRLGCYWPQSTWHHSYKLHSTPSTPHTSSDANCKSRNHQSISSPIPSAAPNTRQPNSHLDLLVPASTGNLVGDEIDAIHLIRVSGKVDANLVRLEIPELLCAEGSARMHRRQAGGGAYLERGIFGGANEHPRVRGPRDAVHGRNVTSQRSDEPARREPRGSAPDSLAPPSTQPTRLTCRSSPPTT